MDLTDEQREELGGVEYRALKTLLWILPSKFISLATLLTLVYFFGFMFLPWICLIPWILRDSFYSNLLDSEAINTSWWALFTTQSLYANVGNVPSMPLIKYRIYLDSRWNDIISTSSLPTPYPSIYHDRRVIFPPPCTKKN